MNSELRERLSVRFITRMCTDSVDIYRNTLSNDGQGGVLNDWRKINTCKCRLMNKADAEKQIAGGIEQVANWIMLAGIEIDIRPRDRVYKSNSNDKCWEVVGSDSGQTELLIQHIDLVEHSV